MDVLVIDVGGSHVKMRSSGAPETQRFKSGPQLTPDALVEAVRSATAGWRYDVVSLGLPATVAGGEVRSEPGNLADGWIRYDFEDALGKPVRVVNDAVMQALGGYDGGRMLFLGLGTGLGSALVSEHVVVPLELGNLELEPESTLAERLGRRGLEARGLDAWRSDLVRAVDMLRPAFEADYILLGGGNAKKVRTLPPQTRLGGNEDAFTGGFRLWEELVEPHDRTPPAVWRVVR